MVAESVGDSLTAPLEFQIVHRVAFKRLAIIKNANEPREQYSVRFQSGRKARINFMTICNRSILRAAKTCLISVGLLVAVSGAASAYVTCNSHGDCWHTDDQVKFPNVTLSYHDDAWRDQHRNDEHYKWHDTDNDHDWHHGYWDNGAWHSN